MSLYYGLVFDSINARDGYTIEVGGEYEVDWVRSVNLDSRPAWRSQYAFDEEGKTYIEKQAETGRGMSRDFGGKVYATEVILDFDGDPYNVYKDINMSIVQMYKYLDVDLDHLRIYRSGRKGIHMHIDGRLFDVTPTRHTASIIKETIRDLFPYETLDLAPMGVHSHIRLPFSLHTGTGNLKSSIAIEDCLSSFDTFQEAVSKTRFLDPVFGDAPDPVLNRYLQMSAREVRYSQSRKTLSRLDPTKHYTCMQFLLESGPQVGDRHNQVLRLASWMWRSGIPSEYASSMLVKWADDVSMSSEIDKVVRDTYARRYAYGCNDEIMSRFCSRHCSFHHNKGSTMDFESTADLQEHLREYIEKLQIGNLIDIGTKYGAYEPYNIVPGELVVLTADTGIGKSMLVQDIILDTEKNTLYLNLEMNKHLLYRRMLQTKLNKTKEEINEMVISGQISPDVASNVKMHSDAITIDDIKQAVIHLRPEILVVDTTDGINVKEAGNNDLFKMGKILEGLRSIAQKQNIIVICVHHLNKSGAKETQGIVNMKGEKIAREIQLTDLVGKQDIVTKVDHVLALEGDRSTGLRKLRSMKSRDSAPLDVELEFDFEKQQVRSARRDIDIDELKKVFDETGNIYE